MKEWLSKTGAVVILYSNEPGAIFKRASWGVVPGSFEYSENICRLVHLNIQLGSYGY